MAPEALALPRRGTDAACAMGPLLGVTPMVDPSRWALPPRFARTTQVPSTPPPPPTSIHTKTRTHMHLAPAARSLLRTGKVVSKAREVFASLRGYPAYPVRAPETPLETTPNK